MPTNRCLPTGTFCAIVWAGVSTVSFGKGAPTVLPVPADPLELVTGPVQPVQPQDRQGVLQLLQRARDRFTLRSAQEGYDLKINFTVDSGGQTNYDGSWEMEDINLPEKGLHWTAKSATGYMVSRISLPSGIYSEETANSIPLRLQEARGLLNHPLPSLDYANRGSIRTSTATFRGATVTCLLLSRLQNPTNPALGRGWDEAEECIDPQSGLLQVHSEAPGRYVVYDYSNGFRLGDHLLPRSVTVTEAARIVSRISVEGLTPITNADPNLFVVSNAMKATGAATAIGGAATASGAATVIGGAERISRVHGPKKPTSGMKLRAVCVFGVITPTGQLVEAHSLQPSDPASNAALMDAEGIDFSPLVALGAPPEQRFVFVIEKFLSKR